MKIIRIPFIVPIIFMCLLGFISPAWADSDTNKTYVQLLNEVFQTELVYPQGKGEVQIFLEGAYSEGDEGKGYHLPLVVEYGITDSWQLGLDWTLFQQHNPEDGHTASGTGDLALTTKYAFMNMGGSDFHASLNFAVEFPIADIDKHLTEGFTVYEPSISLAKDFTGNNSQIFTQIGIGFVDRTREPTDPADKVTIHDEFFWSSGFFIPYNKEIIFSGEFSWVSDELEPEGHENLLFLTPGVIWSLPGHHWEFGLAVPIGLNDESDDWGIILALIYEFDTH